MAVGLVAGLAVVMAAATIPTAFGFLPMVVLSGSMEPTLRVGDVAVARRMAPTDLHLGDVGTYRSGDTLITHRIIGIELQGSGPVFHFKGDNNATADPQAITSDRIVGRVLYRIPWMGYIIVFASTTVGKVVLIAVPFIGLLLMTLRDRAKKAKPAVQGALTAQGKGS
jgi:signal peptidase